MKPVLVSVAILTCCLLPAICPADEPWSAWKGQWQEIQQNVQRSWKDKKDECSEKVHDYWTQNRQNWKSTWNDVKAKPAEIWRNQIDPQETYTEEVTRAARDPNTANRIVSVALSGNGKNFFVEKLRFVPIYDPYTQKVRTLDAVAQEVAGWHSDYLKGSAFAADPTAACALTAMLDRKFLWNEKILRTKSGEWVSVKEALAGATQRAVGERLESLHGRALAAFQEGKADECAVRLAQFADILNEENRMGLDSAAPVEPANVVPVLMTVPDKEPAPLITQLEANPAELLRDGVALGRVGKTYLARETYQKIVDQYPHSGFADDALYKLAQDDYANLNYDAAVNRLNLLLERYYRSDLCDDALFMLGNCYVAKVVPSDEQRMAAVRNYKEILRQYEDGSKNWKAEVIQLVVDKEKAVQCYRLLLASFADSPYAGREKKVLVELEGN